MASQWVKVDIDQDGASVEELLPLIRGSLTYMEVFDLIKELDAGMGEWDFTEKLYQHFKKLHDEYLMEEKLMNDLEGLSSEQLKEKILRLMSGEQ